MKSTSLRTLTLMILCLYTTCANSQSGYITHDAEYEIVCGPSGLHTQPIHFSPEKLFPKPSWKGDWIWLNSKMYKGYQKTRTEWGQSPQYGKKYKALFRKNFVLNNLHVQACISLTADVAFRVYINGVFVAQGPPNTGNDYFDGVPPQHWFFTTHNIKKHLKAGINTVAVEVFSHFREISETSSGEGLLICDIDNERNESIVASDSGWKCIPDTSFRATGGHYICDARAEISQWIQPSFDDSDWGYASVKDFPKTGYLRQSMIPVPFRHPIAPEGVFLPHPKPCPDTFSTAFFHHPFGRETFTLDYGRNITAYYGFDVIANENDTLKIFPSEKRYSSPKRVLTYICKEGLNRFDAPFLSVFRYLKVEVTSGKKLLFKEFRTTFSTYPVNHLGSFACSDSTLTQLWDISRWTTQLCMNDMFYDSPSHQEPIACTGDYFIESLINYYAFGDPWLTGQTLVKTALMLQKNNFDMFHTSYSLLWIQMLHRYYQYTGDAQKVRELLPQVNQLIRVFETYLDSNSLVSKAPDYMFMDWIKIDKYNAHHPPAVIGMGYMTAFYYKALLDAAELNELFHNTSVRNNYLQLAQKIRLGMNDLLWDQRKKRYKDGIPFRGRTTYHYFFPKDTNIVTYSPHVNSLAVLYGIAPEEYHAALLDYIENQNETDLQPYFMFYVLSAVEQAGLFGTMGLRLLKKWEKGISTETFTLKENWQDSTVTGYRGDYSHAWGGSPLYFLSRNILGIKPASAGFAEAELLPFTNDHILWARGRVPLTGGSSIGIAWEKEHNHKYNYSLDIPENFKLFLVIPKDMQPHGIRINNIPYPPGTSRVRLDSGIFELEFQNQ